MPTWTRDRPLLASVVFVVLGLAYAACGPEMRRSVVATGCANAGDCTFDGFPLGTICTRGYCIAPTVPSRCVVTAECPASEYPAGTLCIAGRCVPPEIPPPAPGEDAPRRPDAYGHDASVPAIDADRNEGDAVLVYDAHFADDIALSGVF